jgi:hypothetical protein
MDGTAIVTSFSSTKSTPSPGSPGPLCPGHIDKLWEDIVILLDVSNSMGIEVAELVGKLSESFNNVPVSQSVGHASRVGIVTFAENATVVGDLNKYNSTKALTSALFGLLQPAKGKSKLNIESALQTAGNLFLEVESGRRRKVVILCTTAYSDQTFEDPVKAAAQLVESNVKLITIAFVEKTETQIVQKVGQLASPGYNLTADLSDKNNSLTSSLNTALTNANCFCDGNWMQVVDGNVAYADCLYPSSLALPWNLATQTCQAMDNSSLPTVFSSYQEQFLSTFAQSQFANDAFLLGLHWATPKNEYVWETVGGQIPLGNGYTHWAPGSPNTANDAKDCVAQQSPSAGWQNIDCSTEEHPFFCQVAACSTDNYCGPPTMPHA